MRINNLTLCAGIALALFSSCGSSKRTLPTSDEFPVITIGASNAQLKTTYPATSTRAKPFVQVNSFS